jgi:hypothetical protein
MRRPIQSLLAAVIAAGALFAGSLAGAGPAAASTDFAFATGNAPDIAVDGAGTAHVVWVDFSQVQARTIYCRIPRGARECTNTQVLYTGSMGGPPRVLLIAPQKVIVLHGPYPCGGPTQCMLIRESIDDGLTFVPGAPTVAKGRDVSAGGEAVYGPGNSVSFVNDGNRELEFVNSSLGPPAQTTSTPAKLTPEPAVYGAALGLWGNVPVVVYRDGVTLRWRRYEYGLFTCHDLNVASCWSTAQDIDTGPFGGRASLAGGPSGLFLYYEQGPAGATQGVVRKFTGSGWGPAIPVTSTGYLRPGDLTQDASGRLHAVWYNNGGADDRLTQWRTSTDGVNWGPTVTIDAAPDFLQTPPASLHVGAAPDGQGFAVWDSGQPGGAFDYLLAVPLEPFTFPTQPTQPVQPPQQQQQTQPPAKGAPVLSGFTIGTSTLRPGGSVTFAFVASESGRAVLAFYRLGDGLKLGPSRALRCVASNRARLNALRKALAAKPEVARLHGKARQQKLAKLIAARRCTTTRRIGDIQSSVRAGRNTIVFNGTLAGRKLAPGRYRAVLVIYDATGNTSRQETVEFRIVAPKKRQHAGRAAPR